MINDFDPIHIPETTKIRIREDFYLKFCNQVEKGENRSEREVFTTDWQRFLGAFILGIHEGKRTPYKKSDKTHTPFGFDVFKNKQKMLRLIIGLTLQELYKDTPKKLKEDFETAELEGRNLGTDIKVAMEEFANTGFAKMMYKTSTIPGYIESMEDIVSDILEKE